MNFNGILRPQNARTQDDSPLRVRSNVNLIRIHLRESAAKESRRGSRECLRSCARGFRLLGQLAKARRIFQGDIGENLAVELDACPLQSIDEVAIGQAVQAGGGADADDPDSAELALLLFA